MVRLNAAGSALEYATFLGGSDNDVGQDIVLDGSGRVYVTGSARSNNFPVTSGAFATGYKGGSDAYVARLNATGSALEYATFLGGSSDDNVVAIVLDASGWAYVTGNTYSSNFPTTPGAFDTTHNGDRDGFVARLNAAGNALEYATFSRWDRG